MGLFSINKRDETTKWGIGGADSLETIGKNHKELFLELGTGFWAHYGEHEKLIFDLNCFSEIENLPDHDDDVCPSYQVVYSARAYLYMFWLLAAERIKFLVQKKTHGLAKQRIQHTDKIHSTLSKSCDARCRQLACFMCNHRLHLCPHLRGE